MILINVIASLLSLIISIIIIMHHFTLHAITSPNWDNLSDANDIKHFVE